MSKYQKLVKSIIEDIEGNRFSDNTKLPSLRQFAFQHKISISTAINCYQELVAQGWVVVQPKRGFFVKKIKHNIALPEFKQFISVQTEPIKNKTPYRENDGCLGVSYIPIDDDIVTELDRCFIRSVKRKALKNNRYPYPIGEPKLRKAISQNFCTQGLAVNSDQLVITHGAMCAINTALEIIVKPGDTIAISSPCFSGYMDLLANLSLKVIEVPLDQNGIDLKQLEQHLKSGNIQAGLFSTSFINPQGITLSIEQKIKIANLAAYYKTPIIEDDVYIELSHDSTIPLPAKYYDREGYIIWCGSISKSLSASYRLGWCLPGRYFSDFMSYFASSTRGVSLQIQHAITECFNTGLYQKHIKRQRNKIAYNMCKYRYFLQQHLSEIIKISNPDGGMVLWIQIINHDHNVFSQLIQKYKLDIREGYLFSSLPLYNDCIRINVGYPIEQAQEQLTLLIELIKRSQVECEWKKVLRD